MSLDNIEFRSIKEGDVNFIFSSWTESYRDANILRLGVKRFVTGPALWETDIYFKHQRNLISKIIPLSKVEIACNPEEPDQILGYSVSRMEGPINILSYIYVKQVFRRMGLAKILYKRVTPIEVVTHLGVTMLPFVHKHKIIFDPMFDLKYIKEGSS